MELMLSYIAKVAKLNRSQLDGLSPVNADGISVASILNHTCMDPSPSAGRLMN